MKKKFGTFSGFGIGCIITLAVIMIVRFYLLFDGDPFYIRIVEGAWRFFVAFLGTGVIYLVLFFAFYAASGACKYIYRQSEDDQDEKQLMDHFSALSDPLLIICFAVSYLIIIWRL